MSATVEDVRRALADGRCVLCVLSPDAFGVARSLTEDDPVADAAGRPVVYWDREDGFSAPGGVADQPEGLEDPLRALPHAEKYVGAAIFVFNLDGVDIAEEEAAFRRQLKSMAARFTAADQRALVLVSAQPLPASVARLFDRLGYPVEAAATTEPEAGPAPAGPWRDIRQLEKFDTPEWRRRLEAMSPDDVRRIIDGDYHVEAQQRILALRDALAAQFSRKDDIIELMAYAMVAQVPMVLLGPPGTAKSNMIRNFCQGLGLTARAEQTPEQEDDDGSPTDYAGGFFEYLLTRYTTPEEIFGPVHIPDLINKRLYRRVTTGRLPESEVAFLDEIFKASSAIMNTLLAILNERVFHNAGAVMRVPTIMVFAASNEPPQDPLLAALYDRFPIRANCARVEDEHLHELWQRSWELGYDKAFHPEGLSTPQISCTNDFRLLHWVSLCRFGGRSIESAGHVGRVDFGAEFLRVFRSLRRDYDISDRTLRVLYALARSKATVENREYLSVNDLNVFRYVSWDETGTGDLDRLVSNLKRGVSV